MKILQTADWHIGNFKGPEESAVNCRLEDTVKCLQELVKVAKEERPDYVLISGDIFHQAEIWQGRSHKELHIAREIIKSIAEYAGTVIVMRGTPNHDSPEIFMSLSETFELFENVKVITEPTVIHERTANIAVVPGFDKGQFRAKFPGIPKDEENQVFSNELGNIVTGLRAMCTPDKPAILMSHYTVPGCNTESGQVQFLTQFEPVITQEMLLEANYDLVALGHIHRPQIINGLENVYYSGAINEMTFSDEGQERGFWIHYFEDAEGSLKNKLTDSEFHKTPYREFKTIHWSADDVEQAISNPEMLPLIFMQNDVADKIVRIICSCTPDQKRAISDFQIDKALYEAGAFWKAELSIEKVEGANRTELSKYDNPEQNLIQYLREKETDPDAIDRIVERARPIINKALANESVSEFFGTFVPKEIAVKNYRNYVEQSFSFEDISFCTINGMNGSGKSSLFMDAILDCLYEEPREGKIKKGDAPWIRNDEKARSGSITFTFSLGDKTFRVVRTRNKSGKPTLNFAEFVDGDWKDRSKERINDTQSEIVRVIGMDSLTFKACVLIMQDQYGLFLETGKEERIGVLSNLLGLGIYEAMENLAKDELIFLKRDIAGKKKTVEIHTVTIKGYGTPDADKVVLENEITIAKTELGSLSKDKEDKSLILRMQNEAEDRRKKVQASVNALEIKKAATEKNMADLQFTINGCDVALADEQDILEKSKRHNALIEADKELAGDAAIYKTKQDELSRLKSSEFSEQTGISSMKIQLEQKQCEVEANRGSSEDDVIRKKAAEYEAQKKLLDDAYEKERNYRALERKYSDVDHQKANISAKWENEDTRLDNEEQVCKKKAELLDSVQCVDIEHASCAFLSDAVQAKKKLQEFPARHTQNEASRKTEMDAIDSEMNTILKQMEEMQFDKNTVAAISERCEVLKPYFLKLQELKQRENKIALITASITNIQSNIGEAEKRLSEVKLKVTDIEAALPIYEDAAEKHKAALAEILRLKPFVEKAGTYPVIKERKKNAEDQKADAAIRLAEYEKELLEVQAELENTVGATMDIAQLQCEVDKLDTKILSLNRVIELKQQELGSTNQKLDEIERLENEIAIINKSIREIATKMSDYDILKTAFSQDGIPHQIIRSLVPKLSEISSSILGQMTGGKMGIEFQTEKDIKSNSNKEVVTLDIFIEEYGRSVLPYLSKSGGEKVKASLSVILALAEIKSSSAGIQLGMLFIDEPPFLDSDGIQAYCDALETIQSRYPDLKIMAITHDPTMKARFPQSLDVIKTEEGSKIIY